MRFAEFHNALRILISIDRGELVDAGVIAPLDKVEWPKFRDNPWRWFIAASDDQAQRVFAIIERRNKS